MLFSPSPETSIKDVSVPSRQGRGDFRIPRSLLRGGSFKNNADFHRVVLFVCVNNYYCGSIVVISALAQVLQWIHWPAIYIDRKVQVWPGRTPS